MKSIQELIDKWDNYKNVARTVANSRAIEHADMFINDLEQLDEPEVLSEEWIDENKVARINNLRKMTMDDVVPVDKLQNLIVPKQEEVDRAYKDGYETEKQHATEKESEETETVAGVLVDYLLASAKLKLALSMEVEELEE